MNHQNNNQKAQKQSSAAQHGQGHEQMGCVADKNQSAQDHAQTQSGSQQQHADHQQMNSVLPAPEPEGSCATDNCKDSKSSGKTDCK
ncbi:hypothetical protein KI688_008604 [Linnemannia hyalina]|uniref:Uncharacterized protein n=1 Tax=Linnemannia hyalina TaxID=64524 RepID=A0A9P7Y1H1_9FUNG|nr:hypothetical protein KI688_008604 [Linnemannia hyalina]